MYTFIQNILTLPFWARAAIILFLFVFIFWGIFRKFILFILSPIPYCIRKLFQLFYLLIEIPIAALHQKFGNIFYNIDNNLSRIGEKTDNSIHLWYTNWRHPKAWNFWKTLLAYALFLFFILIPSILKTDFFILDIGERIYVHCETSFVRMLKQTNWYTTEEIKAKEAAAAEIAAAQNQEIVPETESEESVTFQTTLFVSGVDNSLLVRDLPVIENCTILERLQNGDAVTWDGTMVFSKADNEHIEPWVKITTIDGIEGWSRLFYLYPELYEEVEFQCMQK